MAKRLPLTDESGEVRELTEEDFAQAKKFSELPENLQSKLSALKTRGPQKKPKKVAISIRLSEQVVDAFKATGEGWQKRIDEVLLQHVSTPEKKKKQKGKKAAVKRAKSTAKTKSAVGARGKTAA